MTHFGQYDAQATRLPFHRALLPAGGSTPAAQATVVMENYPREGYLYTPLRPCLPQPPQVVIPQYCPPQCLIRAHKALKGGTGRGSHHWRQKLERCAESHKSIWSDAGAVTIIAPYRRQHGLGVREGGGTGEEG